MGQYGRIMKERERETLENMLRRTHPLLSNFASSLNRLEYLMSQLTDQVDAALALLSTDSQNLGAVLAANQAAQAVLQGQLDVAKAGQIADEAELQKALDGLNAANAALSAQAAPAPAPADAPAPVDATPAPAPVDAVPAPTDPAAAPAPDPTPPVV